MGREMGFVGDVKKSFISFQTSYFTEYYWMLPMNLGVLPGEPETPLKDHDIFEGLLNLLK